MIRETLLATALAAAPGCDAPQPSGPAVPAFAQLERPPPLAWSDVWLVAHSGRYLDDPAFRREILEASLTKHDNLYSRTRLTAYALPVGGWDALPEWIPHTRPVRADDASPIELGDVSPVWNGKRPTEAAEWIELGRRVFFEYPLRPEVFAEHALAHPEVARRVGLKVDADGTYPGLVAFRDIDGATRVGITCALCHVAVEQDAVVVGRANRDLDYGRMRLAFHRDTGADLPQELQRRMEAWGPGRADITQDKDEDPVAIPDLWGVRKRAYLTQAATIHHVHPAALAIRQETQILHANRERTRPPREIAWAMAMYVYSLAPPPRDHVARGPQTERGSQLFAQHCVRCHSDEHGTGDPIPAERIGTDRTLAFGTARGTGLYRPSPLVRVADAAPYLHDGTITSLDDLLSPQREVPGHRYGTSLPLEDRDALVAYLRVL